MTRQRTIALVDDRPQPVRLLEYLWATTYEQRWVVRVVGTLEEALATVVTDPEARERALEERAMAAKQMCRNRRNSGGRTQTVDPVTAIGWSTSSEVAELAGLSRDRLTYLAARELRGYECRPRLGGHPKRDLLYRYTPEGVEPIGGEVASEVAYRAGCAHAMTIGWVRIGVMCEALGLRTEVIRTRAMNGKGLVRKRDPDGVARAMLYRYVGGES